MDCPICTETEVKGVPKVLDPSPTLYNCPVCGDVKMTRSAFDDFKDERFSENQKKMLSIVLRNEYERRNKKPFEIPATPDDLHRFVREYRPLSSLEKLDYSLLTFEKATEFIGHNVEVESRFDYPLFHCVDPIELKHILTFLLNNRFISPFSGYDRDIYTQYDVDQFSQFFINQKGY